MTKPTFTATSFRTRDPASSPIDRAVFDQLSKAIAYADGGAMGHVTNDDGDCIYKRDPA
jgi:hypothetical protein